MVHATVYLFLQETHCLFYRELKIILACKTESGVLHTEPLTFDFKALMSTYDLQHHTI